MYGSEALSFIGRMLIVTTVFHTNGIKRKNGPVTERTHRKLT
jgi:hypothetical protein